jgi:hypothetical protein
LPPLTRRRIVVLLTGLTVLAFALPFLFVFGIVRHFQEWSSRIHFDSAVWKESLAKNDRNFSVRQKMVDDLLRRLPLLGMKHDQVIDLLGIPPDYGYFRDYDLVYWLGDERGFISIDSEWLVIRFDADDRVSEARLVTD